MSIKCDWCGRKFEGKAHHSGKVGTAVSALKTTGKIIDWLADDKTSISKSKDKGSIFLNNFCSQNCVVSYENNKNTGTIDLDKSERKTEIKIKQEQHKFELKKAKQDYIDERRARKLKDADDYLENNGNKGIYYSKVVWAYLDKTWKKVVFFLALYWIVMSLYIKVFK